MMNEYTVSADRFLCTEGFVEETHMVVRDGVIVDFVSPLSTPSGSPLLDYRGYSVTPFFCDYHLHLYADLTRNVPALSGLFASYGIAEVHDAGTVDARAFDLKTGDGSGIIVKTAGTAIFKKGSYGSYIGQGVDSIEAAISCIDSLKQRGADFIKVINSGIYVPEQNKISRGGFSLKELSMITGYALSRGLAVSCHANGDKAVSEAVEAGVSTIIHGLYISEDTINFMADKEVSFVPTINAFLGLKSIANDSRTMNNIERAVHEHLKTVKMAAERGVRVLPGSDSGASFLPYGSSYLMELSLLHKAGISIEDTLLSAVRDGLSIGQRASFLVLKGLDIRKVRI